jgi:hypothetical protein
MRPVGRRPVLGRLREGWLALGRRLAAVGSGFVDTFLRDNRVIPLVLALFALLVFAWVVAGVVLSGRDDEQASNRANFAQSEDPAGADPPAPEVENRNADSYAAYQSKDPFRQLLAPAESTSATTPETTAQERTDAGGEGTTGRGTGGGSGAMDSDGDGLSDRKESDLGLDPSNADSDGDGIQDGDEQDSGSRGGGGDGTGGGRAGQDDGLFDSGGDLRLP